MSMIRIHRAVPAVAFLAAAVFLAACGGGPSQPAEEQQPQPAAEEPAEEQPAAEAPSEPSAQAAPAPRPAPSPAPAPAATAAPPAVQPAPEPVVKTVPAGTILEVAFLDALSSRANLEGDPFRARVTEDVSVDGMVVIPAGSMIRGTVVEAVSLKKIGGTAKLALDFSRLELPTGEVVPIDAVFAEAGKSETKRDAATIGGAAAGGALLGRLLSKSDKTKGTVLGAVVGAAAGTAIAAKTEGEEVELPAGTEIAIQLTTPSQVTVR
jgi:hypothetical protein